MRRRQMTSCGMMTVLCLAGCGGGGSGDSSSSPSDTKAPTIQFTSLRLTGNVDTSAAVVAAPRSDEDASPSAYQFSAVLGSGGEPSDPLGSVSSAVVTFEVVATTAAGSDERDITVTIDP